MKAKEIVQSAMRIATGEVMGRIATFILYAYVSRRYGVEVFGIIALGQAVASYVREGSEQGLKLIGVRLLARDRGLADYLVPEICRLRAGFTAVAVALGVGYGLFGPVPAAARTCVVAFVLAVVPYAFALDWVAWGLGHFGVLATWRSGVVIVYVALAIIGMQATNLPVASITGANFIAAACGAVFLWLVWRLLWRREGSATVSQSVREASEQLRVGRVITLGLSNLLNLVFLNADILLLGALSTTHEMGRYSAACRPLYVVFTGFWLLTDVLYPHIAGIKESANARKSLFRWLGLVALGSALLAAALAKFAPAILTVIYGTTMGASGLFRVLLIAMPLDFCFSLLWTVMVSRGYDRFVMYTLAAGAATNVTLNLGCIPRFQAAAAAWVTVASYGVLLGMMLIFVFKHDVFWRGMKEKKWFRCRRNMRYDLRAAGEGWMASLGAASGVRVFQ